MPMLIFRKFLEFRQVLRHFRIRQSFTISTGILIFTRIGLCFVFRYYQAQVLYSGCHNPAGRMFTVCHVFFLPRDRYFRCKTESTADYSKPHCSLTEFLTIDRDFQRHYITFEFSFPYTVDDLNRLIFVAIFGKWILTYMGHVQRCNRIPTLCPMMHASFEVWVLIAQNRLAICPAS